MTEFNKNLCSKQVRSALYVTSSILRGGGSSWTIYNALIGDEPAILIARDTIAKMFGVSAIAVQKFIINSNLATFEATLLPQKKRKQMALTLLSTAVYYWKYLFRKGLLSHLPTRTDERWKKFMADCETLKSGEFLPDMQNFVPGAESSCKPCYDLELVESSTLLECPIESVGILDVVIDRHSQYWIPPQSGLSVIGVPLGWLDNELKLSAKKNRILQQRGFSGRYCHHLCQVPPGGLRYITTLPLEDWLAIWAYFALHQNEKALTLLKLLAQKSIQHFLSQIRFRQAAILP